MFIIFSSSAHAWTSEQCTQIVLTGSEYKFKAKTIPEMIQVIEGLKIDDRDVDHPLRSPWEMGMIPNLYARKLGYQLQLKMLSSWALHENLYDVIHEKAVQVTRDILTGKSTDFSRLPDENQKLIELVKAKKSDRPEMNDVSPFSEWAVCAYYQPWDTTRCFERLKMIVEVMAPVDGITARDRIYEVMKNPAYQEPLSKLALEYMEIIENGLSIDDRKLDEDLLRVLGSENAKWTVLAVLSARGANFYKLFDYASKKDYRTIAALGVISSAALYFDSLNPELFSFPRGVHVGCDSGKSYHFWMSAYLSKRFGSKWAAYLSDVGYQMKSKTEFRDPNRAFIQAWNSPANQRIRLDLAYSAAGAEYGDLDGAKFNFDIEATTNDLEENSEKLSSLNLDQASRLWKAYGIGAFVRWNRIFHPESAMDQ